MRNIKKIGRVILSFLLMFVVVALIGVIFMKQILMNASDLNQQLEDSSYYTQIEESLSAKFKTLSLETSIPEEIFVEAAMDQHGLQQLARTNNEQVLNYLIDPDATYATTTARSLFEEPVTAYVENYAAGHNQPFDDSLQAQTVAVIDEATAIVGSHTMLFNLDNVISFPQFQTFRKMLQTVLAYFYLVPLTFFLIAVALVGLSRRLPHRSLIWIGSGLVSGSAFVIIPAIVALSLKIPQRITVSTDYINTALRTLAMHYTTLLLVAGAMVFFLGTACLVGYNLISKAKQAAYWQNRDYATEMEQY
ncbi:hypothetical protein [Trichococcus pasteurii]|uniref:Uncharacterized protein n=1 Tax=Trichococcus pasteurii TaxID=43064 RepID=A0A1W1IHD9_9LACT|nr:hypothetical protein [Trichococcus pasteurii]SFE55393.1 hypothetical protein SAMN04488086_105154 [Trichococcus pasteurii]SLM52331.1 Hypothetical protein TPAS_2025 [Trichococcus pasteurii]SSB93212.1 Hypothetical protein TPAS_2025 [Trichococcus pasteurii]